MLLLSLTLLAPARAGTCAAYGEATAIASVQGAPFAEASGLAASRARDGVFFTHGDNGDPAVLIAFDRDGNLLDEHLVADAQNEDWEDLAAAPCPDEGDCLYVGDIGDNDAQRQNVTVYVVREPEAGDAKVRSIERWVGVFPNGPADAEALMIHPCTGAVYLATKDQDETVLYRFPPFPEDTVSLEQVARLTLDGPTGESRQVTGGDWDADGERVVLRTSDRLFEWTTDPDAPDAHWSEPPLVIEGTVELQGEGVAYGLDGGLYTTGEGVPVPLTEYACDGYDPAPDPCAFPQTGRKCGCATGGAHPGALAGLLLILALRRRT